MGIVTNRNTRSGKLALFLAALIVLAGFQPGFAETQDVEEIRKKADQGLAGAQFNLGLMYDNGEGVPEDYVKAYAWINLAAAQGQKIAVESKDLLRQKMTTEQVAEAQKLAGELFKRIESSKSE